MTDAAGRNAMTGWERARNELREREAREASAPERVGCPSRCRRSGITCSRK